jgi:hypothetical protein
MVVVYELKKLDTGRRMGLHYLEWKNLLGLAHRSFAWPPARVSRIYEWELLRKDQEVDYGERTTGTRDEHYDLIAVLYHALHGADNCDHYALDAEAAGDERLAAFFREAQGEQMLLAERAKELLGISVPPSEVDVCRRYRRTRW